MMNCCFNSKKNTVSFTGASFAPSCRAFDSNTDNMIISDTVLAVSVLFYLIAALALFMLNAIIGITSILLIIMLTLTILTNKTSKSVI